MGCFKKKKRQVENKAGRDPKNPKTHVFIVYLDTRADAEHDESRIAEIYYERLFVEGFLDELKSLFVEGSWMN